MDAATLTQECCGRALEFGGKQGLALLNAR